MKYSFDRKVVALIGGMGYVVVSFLIIFINHHFYDDEIYNLLLIENSASDIVSITQSWDAHPPLSYLINKAIYALTGHYKSILIASVFLNAAGLFVFYRFAQKQVPDLYSNIILFMFTFFNSALLMWANSVRWQAYWVPLFLFLYVYILERTKYSYVSVAIVAVTLSLMTYINYLTFLAAISFFVYMLIYQRTEFTIKNILLFTGIYLLLSGYQLYYFIAVHIHAAGSQLFSIPRALLASIYGILNGGPLFPASGLFLLFAVATFSMLVASFINVIRSKLVKQSVLLKLVLLFSVLFILEVVTGTGGKYRNNLVLSLQFFLVFSILVGFIKNKSVKLMYIAISFLAVSVSIYNLVMHEGTAKNSYNAPVRHVESLVGDSGGKVVITYDPTIYMHLKNRGYNAKSLFYDYDNFSFEKGVELFVVSTYQGSVSDEDYSRVQRLYEALSRCISDRESIQFGRIEYLSIKNRIKGQAPKLDPVQFSAVFGVVDSECAVGNWRRIPGLLNPRFDF